MSGGYFDYAQYHMEDIIDNLESVIGQNNVPIPREDLDNYDRREYDYSERAYEASDSKMYHYEFSPEVTKRLKEGLYILRRAYVYAQRIDWLLSGDDGEEDFIERLEEELQELQEKHSNIETTRKD